MSKKTPEELAATKLKQHVSLCLTCKHDSINEIEQKYIGWHSVMDLTRTYGLDLHSLYRHAIAFGWKEKTNKNIDAAIDRLLMGGLTETNIKNVEVKQAIATLKLKLQKHGQLKSGDTQQTTVVVTGQRSNALVEGLKKLKIDPNNPVIMALTVAKEGDE